MYKRQGLSRLNLLGRLDGRLPVLRSLGVPNRDIEFLGDRARELRRVHDEMTHSASDVVHGDAQVANSVVFDNAVALIDLDGLRVGPREYDLVPTAIAGLRFGKHAEFEHVVGGYGADPREWEFFDDAVNIRQVTMTSWLGTFYGRGDRYHQEFTSRVNSLREGDQSARWNIVV